MEGGRGDKEWGRQRESEMNRGRGGGWRRGRGVAKESVAMKTLLDQVLDRWDM
jgi:hypothetical protein